MILLSVFLITGDGGAVLQRSIPHETLATCVAHKRQMEFTEFTPRGYLGMAFLCSPQQENAA